MPTLYNGWFWTGEVRDQMLKAVGQALADGLTRMEVNFPPVPNLEEVDFGTALNQQFAIEIRDVLGMEDQKYKIEVRRSLIDFANLYWSRALAAVAGGQPVYVQYCDQTSKKNANSPGENVWIGRLETIPRTLTERQELSIVVNPGDVSQWKKALSYSGPSSPLIFLNRESFAQRDGSTKGVEQVYYLKRISKGWVFRQYPGPWQALVEKPDGTVECVATYNKRPLLREVSKVVREYSFQQFSIFNDRY
ncbi:hypothetical protein GUITHDRAFT_48967, partial [Guillardia theta CCMP2712]